MGTPQEPLRTATRVEDEVASIEGDFGYSLFRQSCNTLGGSDKAILLRCPPAEAYSVRNRVFSKFECQFKPL